jgi:dolichol-phosphate mannosyltransferase
MDQTIKRYFCDEITRNMNDCIVIIPTYNEIENIESIIRSVLSQHKPFHILIVDDNSPDHTARRVRLLQTDFSGVYFGK